MDSTELDYGASGFLDPAFASAAIASASVELNGVCEPPPGGCGAIATTLGDGRARVMAASEWDPNTCECVPMGTSDPEASGEPCTPGAECDADCRGHTVPGLCNGNGVCDPIDDCTDCFVRCSDGSIPAECDRANCSDGYFTCEGPQEGCTDYLKDEANPGRPAYLDPADCTCKWSYTPGESCRTSDGVIGTQDAYGNCIPNCSFGTQCKKDCIDWEVDGYINKDCECDGDCYGGSGSSYASGSVDPCKRCYDMGLPCPCDDDPGVLPDYLSAQAASASAQAASASVAASASASVAASASVQAASASVAASASASVAASASVQAASTSVAASASASVAASASAQAASASVAASASAQDRYVSASFRNASISVEAPGSASRRDAAAASHALSAVGASESAQVASLSAYKQQLDSYRNAVSMRIASASIAVVSADTEASKKYAGGDITDGISAERAAASLRAAASVEASEPGWASEQAKSADAALASLSTDYDESNAVESAKAAAQESASWLVASESWATHLSDWEASDSVKAAQKASTDAVSRSDGDHIFDVSLSNKMQSIDAAQSNEWESFKSAVGESVYDSVLAEESRDVVASVSQDVADSQHVASTVAAWSVSADARESRRYASYSAHDASMDAAAASMDAAASFKDAAAASKEAAASAAVASASAATDPCGTAARNACKAKNNGKCVFVEGVVDVTTGMTTCTCDCGEADDAAKQGASQEAADSTRNAVASTMAASLKAEQSAAIASGGAYASIVAASAAAARSDLDAVQSARDQSYVDKVASGGAEMSRAAASVSAAKDAGDESAKAGCAGVVCAPCAGDPIPLENGGCRCNCGGCQQFYDDDTPIRRNEYCDELPPPEDLVMNAPNGNPAYSVPGQGILDGGPDNPYADPWGEPPTVNA